MKHTLTLTCWSEVSHVATPLVIQAKNGIVHIFIVNKLGVLKIKEKVKNSYSAG